MQRLLGEHSPPKAAPYLMERNRPVLVQVRMFKADNPDYGTAEAETGVRQRRHIEFNLTCVFGREGTRLDRSQITMLTTAQGLPMTSAAALRALCGKPGAAKKALKDIDSSNVHASRAEHAEALGDGVAFAAASGDDAADTHNDGDDSDEEAQHASDKFTCAPATCVLCAAHCRKEACNLIHRSRI
jgi:hypothetical protein